MRAEGQAGRDAGARQAERRKAELAEHQAPVRQGVEGDGDQHHDEGPERPLQGGEEAAQGEIAEEGQQAPLQRSEDSPSPRASAGSWPSNRRIASACQSRSHIGPTSVIAAQSPRRTVRPTSRTAWRLRPSSIESSGVTALITPMPKTSVAM